MKKTGIFSLVIAIILIATICILTTRTFASEADTKEVSEEQTENLGEVLTIGAEGEKITTTEDGESSEETQDIHEGDLYVLFGEENKSATDYTMDKMVDGNVFIMGNNVTITGAINGNLYVMATKLTITEDAYIAMDLYALAQDITLSGYTFDAYIMCDNFDMTKTGVAYRDLKLMTNNAHLIGSVGRDVDLGAKNITVFDDSDNKFFVGNNLNYSSEKEIEHLEDITIYGKVNYEEAVEENTENNNVVLNYVIEALKNVVFAVVIYAVLIFLTPKFVQKSKEYISTRGLLAAAIGLAFTILVPILAIILLFTVIGIKLAFLAGLVYVLVLMLSSAVVTIAINEFICGKCEKLNATWKKILMIMVIALALYLIKLIPVLGSLVSLVVFLAGVGITILYQFDKRKEEEVKE